MGSSSSLLPKYSPPSVSTLCTIKKCKLILWRGHSIAVSSPSTGKGSNLNVVETCLVALRNVENLQDFAVLSEASWRSVLILAPRSVPKQLVRQSGETSFAERTSALNLCPLGDAGKAEAADM